jgi:hypothetical protein
MELLDPRLLNRGNPGVTSNNLVMEASEINSDKIYTGIITFRAWSLTPYVQHIIGTDYEMVPVLVEHYTKAREMDGTEVKFKKIMWPYGPDIRSDCGFADIQFNTNA